MSMYGDPNQAGTPDNTECYRCGLLDKEVAYLKGTIQNLRATLAEIGEALWDQAKEDIDNGEPVATFSFDDIRELAQQCGVSTNVSFVLTASFEARLTAPYGTTAEEVLNGLSIDSDFDLDDYGFESEELEPR